LFARAAVITDTWANTVRPYGIMCIYIGRQRAIAPTKMCGYIGRSVNAPTDFSNTDDANMWAVETPAPRRFPNIDYANMWMDRVTRPCKIQMHS